jgi:hypothetical protein
MPNVGALVDGLATSTSRRGFLARASRMLALAAGAGAVRALVSPGEADAFHFCGHIYTTDSCPHPTGLPRIDAHGFALRAADGAPVDDLGRPIDAAGFPVDANGSRLLDPDGRPSPAAPRSRVCQDAVARQFDLHTRIDGAWYRCCGGHVRKLVDCCARTPKRINGDGALTGYCYAGRRVFCVMYYDTKIPC